jgi:2-keto-4-pentenoate hydratase/2-oxohepta-3-ene-1,7-dioic acid hydratase in catechol pathway
VKIVVYGPERRTGALRDGSVVDLSYACAKYLRERTGERHAVTMAAAVVPPDLARFIEGGPRVIESAQKALDHLGNAHNQLTPRGDRIDYPLSEVRLHAPKPAGAKVACAGGNFADHQMAMAAKFGDTADLSGDVKAKLRGRGMWGFWKVDREAAGPDANVIYPSLTRRLDYEGELAIVLGKDGKDIKAADGKSYIWGVTLFSDWSIRDMHEPNGPLKFAMQKNFDTSHSIGPCIVVGEQVDAYNADVETYVNSDRRQHYNTRDMVFSFGDFMEYLSRDFTLRAGDIISGGTAAGTAADSSNLLPDKTFPNDRFLKPGDTVEVRSPAIGVLRNRIVAKGA